MTKHSVIGVFLLALLLPYVSACRQEPETPDWRMTLKTIRNGIHRIDTYLNAALDLFGGDDGLCHYKCSDGEHVNNDVFINYNSFPLLSEAVLRARRYYRHCQCMRDRISH